MMEAQWEETPLYAAWREELLWPGLESWLELEAWV